MSGKTKEIDPFFEFVPDTNWNACIGRQGHEYQYIDGYIEAAIELAENIISKKLWAQRDTLILPILFNARHSIELLLKSVCDRFSELGILSANLPKNHDILKYWLLLNDLNFGDHEFRTLLGNLRPFVESLSKIDDDGQALRYFESRDGKQSMDDRSVVNIRLVAASVKKLKKLQDKLQYRVRRLELERPYGFHTNRCSRQDLLEIASMLPHRNAWSDKLFDDAKEKIKERFCLSNGQFSKALNVIQTHRQMKLDIGLESNLNWITDEKLLRFIVIWRTLHFDTQGQEANVFVFPDDLMESNRIDEIFEHRVSRNKAIEELTKFLSAREIRDVNEVFQIGRNEEMAELYDHLTKELDAEFDISHNKTEELGYLLDKSNLASEVAEGLRVLGRPSLADQIQKQA